MRIRDLSRSTEVAIETIRHYEKERLLPRSGRKADGRREYGQAHLERLAFIRHCRAMDMPLTEVKRLLHLDEVIAGHPARLRKRLQSLRTLERHLCALRSRCRSSHLTASRIILHEMLAAAHVEANLERALETIDR